MSSDDGDDEDDDDDGDDSQWAQQCTVNMGGEKTLSNFSNLW